MMSTSFTFHNWISVWILVALIIVPFAIFVKAPYGRHSRKGWGTLIENNIGWFLMELPTVIICPLIYVYGTADKSIVTHCFILIFMFHYINRVFIYPFRIRTTGKKIPLFIVLSAFTFNFINGFNIGYEFGFIKVVQLSWFGSWQFIVGICMFFLGVIINWKSDRILINLRQPGETDYKIPQGFLFKYISCPNHFGELIEWLGFAILTWSMSGFAFFIWTASNLIPRSLNHHQWYQDQFEQYPKNRKAVFPKVL